MSDDPASQGVETAEPGEEEDARPRKLSGKVLVPYIALLLVPGGGGFAAMTFPGGEEEAVAEDGRIEKKAVFYDLPEVLVNLSQREKRRNFSSSRFPWRFPTRRSRMPRSRFCRVSSIRFRFISASLGRMTSKGRQASTGSGRNCRAV